MNQLAALAKEIYPEVIELGGQVFGGFLRDMISGDIDLDDWDGDLDIVGDEEKLIFGLAKKEYWLKFEPRVSIYEPPVSSWLVAPNNDGLKLRLHIKSKVEMTDLDINSLIVWSSGRLGSITGNTLEVLAAINRREFRACDPNRVRPERKTKLIARGWKEITGHS